MPLLKTIYSLKPAWGSACGCVSQQETSEFSGKLWRPMVISELACLDATKQVILTTSSHDQQGQAVRWEGKKGVSVSYCNFWSVLTCIFNYPSPLMQLYLFCWKSWLSELKHTFLWDEQGLSFQKTLKNKFLTSLLPHNKYSQYEVTVQLPSLYFYGFDYQ